MSFADDIKGQNTQLYPVVKIGEDYYSTNNVTVDGNYCKPILMNIPSIKESVDVESRKFKISNVSLQFNNFPFDGVRFSDQLSESSLINAEATIYFKSPSTTTIPDDENPLDTDLQEVYKGIIRRISHDDSKVSVELEDLTEQKAHKDLPQVSLGEGNEVPDKYKNKPIPMVYGQVDRSPCVLRMSGGTYVIPDANQIKDYISENSSLIGNTLYPLYQSGGGSYANIPQFMLTNSGHANTIGWDLNQYILADDPLATISFDTNTKQYISEPSPFNDINCELLKFNDSDLFINNLLFTSFLSHSSSFDVLLPPNDWVGENANSPTEAISIMDLADSDFANLSIDDETFVLFDNQRTYLDGTSAATFNMAMPFLLFKYSVDRSFAFESEVITFFFNGTRMDRDDNFDIPTVGTEFDFIDPSGVFTHDESYFLGTAMIDTGYQLIETDAQADFLFQYEYEASGLTPSIQNVFGEHPAAQDSGFVCIKGTETNAAQNGLSPKGFDGFKLGFTNVSFGNFYSPKSITIKIRAKRLDYWRWGISKGILGEDFYANVKGRINTFDDHPDAPTDDFIQNPIDIIYDLVKSELGHDAIDEDEYTEAKLAHVDWKFGFTVNKKISSKQLIAEIANSTKCFPKFKNDGTFGFNTIKDNYDVDIDYAGATPIKESEVISYSFKKTKPEQIYKKVTVSYNKDYAQDSYLKTALSEDLGADPYYGIENSSDAHLQFESDYIRDKDTADDLVSFLSEQYKNDHLLFNLKLPLQYINLEIGDLVKFEDLFQDLTAYGIIYTEIFEVNSQYRYPLFMVTSTTKNLDSVSIECMQLHNLDGDVSEWIEVEVEEEVVIAGSGDNNADGIVNILDVVRLTNHILNGGVLNDAQVAESDLNGDGGINILDIVGMVNIILEDE